mmetsp:Transcript_3273/g.7687  ORF Transcript_3273/g.7687 Transcript_3273/m.7687 type:complete len:216 (-) Transcript_3273:292-939(-)
MYNSAATPKAVHPTKAGSLAASALAASPPTAEPSMSMMGPRTTAGTARCRGWEVHAAAKVRPRKPISTAMAAAMNMPALLPVTSASPTSRPSMAESIHTAIANTHGKGGVPRGSARRFQAPVTMECRCCCPSSLCGEDPRRPLCTAWPLICCIRVEERSAFGSSSASRPAVSSASPSPCDASESSSPSSMMIDMPIMTSTPRQKPTTTPVIAGLP